MQLSLEQLVTLDGSGFVRMDTMTDVSEVSEIRDIMTHLIQKKAGMKSGAFFDMLASAGQTDSMKLVQIRNVSDYSPRLAKTNFVRSAKIIAQQILGPEARLWFDMLILKPAHSPADTPWHQDEAFCDPTYEHKEITFWMPLQNTTVENGCMSFIEGSHKGSVLSHRSPGNDTTVHALECCGEFDASTAVACPLPAGGCSIHYGRTIHSAGANHSATPRYAYILGFHIPPTLAKEERSFPWLTEKRTGDSAITKAWLLRGGILAIALRKIRRGEFFTIDGFRYSVRRTINLIFSNSEGLLK